MSADRWSECVLCDFKMRQLKDKIYSTGIKSLTPEENDEYTVLKDSLKENDGTPLREDYEQGINEDGTLFVVYSGVCQICGASWQFRTKDILPEDPEDKALVKKLQKEMS